MEERVVLEIPMNIQEGSEILNAAARLFRALNQQEIRYCHWKSNLRLALGLQGRTDLDLLVDRKQRRAFREILHQQNIKPLLPANGQRFPAMEHYLAYDDATGKLLHLHVHYQLVLGEQFVKNFQLPLEDQFLDSVYLREGVKLPAPELELIILSIRVLLKYRDRDAIKDILSIRSSKIETTFMEEFDWLLSQTSIEAVARSLAALSGVIPPAFVMDFLNTIRSNPRAGFRLLKLRHQARQILRLYRRTPPLQATFEYFREMLGRLQVIPGLQSPTKMTLPEGGWRIAVIGIDGAGKSTLCQLLYKWLSWKLNVHVSYLGSKPPSQRSKMFYLIFRILRRGQSTVSNMLGMQNPLSKWLSELKEIALAYHYLSIGHDRYSRYMAGEKWAMNGSLVIYDRFPLGRIAPELDSVLMDGPQISSIAGNRTSRLIHLLSRAETNIYQQMRTPDYVIVLNVGSEVSIQRKPAHTLATLEAKNKAICELAALGASESKKPRTIYINANAPLEEVAARVKNEVWDLL